MADFFEGLSGSAADYMGGGYVPFGGAAATAPVEYTGTPTEYVTNAPIQGYTPTFNFDFSSFLPSTSFAPQMTGMYAEQAPTAFAGPVTQPSYESLQPLYQSAMQPLPPIVKEFGGPRGADFRSGLYDTSALTGITPTAEAPTAKAGAEGLFGIKGLSTGDLLKAALGIGGGLMGMQAQQRAAEEAAAARREYEAASQKAAGEVKTLAQPYLTIGGPQLSMAAQGRLGPAQMQQYQAAQAQLAQQAAKTGGVGAIQTQQALQNIYQQALQNQQNMALQLLGPGNELAYRAVMENMRGTQGGLQMELQLAQAANQASMNMYGALASMIGGTRSAA